MKDCRDFLRRFFSLQDIVQYGSQNLSQNKIGFRFAGRRLKVVVPYGCKTTCRKANITAVGDTTYRQVNITLQSKILLQFLPLSSRQVINCRATLPTERAPFVALRHFPRFIGEIHPIGESKESEFFQRYID